MQFDLIPILSTIILATTIVTIILAIGSYVAYKLRDKRRMRSGGQGRIDEEPARAFRRYRPGG